MGIKSYFGAFLSKKQIDQEAAQNVMNEERTRLEETIRQSQQKIYELENVLHQVQMSEGKRQELENALESFNKYDTTIEGLRKQLAKLNEELEVSKLATQQLVDDNIRSSTYYQWSQRKLNLLLLIAFALLLGGSVLGGVQVTSISESGQATLNRMDTALARVETAEKNTMTEITKIAKDETGKVLGEIKEGVELEARNAKEKINAAKNEAENKSISAVKLINTAQDKAESDSANAIVAINTAKDDAANTSVISISRIVKSKDEVVRKAASINDEIVNAGTAVQTNLEEVRSAAREARKEISARRKEAIERFQTVDESEIERFLNEIDEIKESNGKLKLRNIHKFVDYSLWWVLAPLFVALFIGVWALMRTYKNEGRLQSIHH